MKTEIEIDEELYEYNNKIAAVNREKFKAKGVYVLNIMGSPGSGKTTLLENILPKLQKQLRVAVIEGDIATQNDALRIQKTGANAIQINTDGGCLACGEPIGASGLRQVYENTVQLRGRGGERQVPNGPKVGYSHVYGAPGLSAVAILER